MKVILLTDVPKQGKKNAVINVSDGYAKNYLLKNNLAVIADQTSLRNLDKTIERQKNTEEETIKEQTLIKDKLEKEKLEFKVKVGKEDKVFGCISSKQIVELLNNIGYNIKKEMVVIDNPLSSLGTHRVKIVLHKKVIAAIEIKLIK